MILRVKLEKPIGGYWDGGLKDTFDFKIDGYPHEDSKGQYVKVGSWQANSWFHVAVGRTDKETLRNAKTRLRIMLEARLHDNSFEFIYVED